MATRSLGTLTLDLIARMGGFEQGMDKAAREAAKRTREIRKSLSELAETAKWAGAILGGALVGGVALVAKNSMDAQSELAQLDAILKSTGNAAGYSRDQLLDMANKLSKSSIFSGGEIVKAQTRLLSYSGIVGELLPRAMQNVIDQSTRLGISVEQSAETIGRALESPTKAAGALANQGFGAAFTAEVKATIAALEEQGRVADAQKIILGILEESYAGAARAARDVLGGALTALKNTFADLLTGDVEGDGVRGLVKSINDLNEAMNDPAVVAGFGAMVSGLVDLAAVAARATGGLSRWFAEMKQRDELSDAVMEWRALNDQIERIKNGGLILRAFGRDTAAELDQLQRRANAAAMVVRMLSQDRIDATLSRFLSPQIGGEDVVFPLRAAGAAAEEAAPKVELIADAVKKFRENIDQQNRELAATLELARKGVDVAEASIQANQRLSGATEKQIQRNRELRQSLKELQDAQKEREDDLKKALAAEAKIRDSVQDFEDSLRSPEQAAWDEYRKIRDLILADVGRSAEKRTSLLQAAEQNLSANLLDIREKRADEENRILLEQLQRQREQIEKWNREIQQDVTLRLFGVSDFADLQAALEPMKGMALEVAESLNRAFSSAAASSSRLAAEMLLFGENGKDAARQIARTLLVDVVSGYIQAAAKAALFYTLQQTGILRTSAVSQAAAAATATSQAAANAEIAASAAPAAAGQSLASYGANVAIALAGIAAVYALTRSFNGFSQGGYTGNFGRSEVAGVVHGQEFVVNAAATQQYRGLLEAINNGRVLQAPAVPQLPPARSPQIPASVSASLAAASKPVVIESHGADIQVYDDIAAEQRIVARAVQMVTRSMLQRGSPTDQALRAQFQVKPKGKP